MQKFPKQGLSVRVAVFFFNFAGLSFFVGQSNTFGGLGLWKDSVLLTEKSPQLEQPY